jgi:hypothetical protein
MLDSDTQTKQTHWELAELALKKCRWPWHSHQITTKDFVIRLKMG